MSANPWEDFAKRGREPHERRAGVARTGLDGRTKPAGTPAGSADHGEGSGADAAAMGEPGRSWLTLGGSLGSAVPDRDEPGRVAGDALDRSPEAVPRASAGSGQVGETIREPVKGELELGGRKVDVAQVTMPVPNIRARDDYFVPPDLAGAGWRGRGRGPCRTGRARWPHQRLRPRQIAGHRRPALPVRRLRRGESMPVRDKVVSAAEAVAIIRPGDMVATSGFVGVGTPDAIFVALEERFRATGQPRDLGLLFAAAPGDGKERGLNRLAHDGLIGRVVGGHWSLVPKLGKMAADGLIEAWNLPLGCVSQLFREIAGRRPGLLSRVGLGTFVDPRQGGGKLNAISTRDLVRVTKIDGREWLFYEAFPVEVAIIRGTTADPDGNISMEREALILDNLAIAMAAKASKGFVIAQVERLAAADALPAKQVAVPGVLVDCVVLAPPEHHAQTYGTAFSPAFSGQLRVPLDRIPPLALDERKIIARHCAMELPMGGVVNLGIGMPEAVAAVAKEENLLQQVTLHAEPGIIGGLPQGGLDFVAAINPSAIIAQNQQFDFYDGGGLDLACLGMAQADRQGNVNVSRFGGRFAGSGGFINITQNARALVFAGTFTAGGLRVEAGEGTLRIAHEGRSRKFVATVEQVTFNGGLAASSGQPVLFVTERCVFELTPSGVELVEVAPGIEPERDILELMDFRPLVRDPKPMDARLFHAATMGLEAMLLDRPLAARFTLDPARSMLFIDFAGYRVRRVEQVEAVREHVKSLVEPLGRKVEAVIDYDGCDIDPTIAEAWFDMARDVQARFYDKASRYTTSAFMRLKLGDALQRREMAPHVFASAAETAGPAAE